MGYDLHITRAGDWSASDKTPISLDEWLGFVRSDPEMRLDGFAEATNDEGETVRLEAPGLAVWTAYSGHGVDGNMAWFLWFEGRVDAKNPDEEIRRKLHAIARALGAQVQGDDGEVYGPDGEPLAGSGRAPRRRRGRIAGMRGRVAALVVAALAAAALGVAALTGVVGLWFLPSPTGVSAPPPPAAPVPAPTPGPVLVAEPAAAAVPSPERWTGTCVLRGRATRPDETPWTGVIALADRYADEEEPPPTVRTAADGTFRFEGLAARQVRVVAREGVGRVIPGPRVLLPCEEEIAFVVGAGLVEFEGRVVADADGAPVAGAAIRVEGGARNGPLEDRATSDADGRFRIRGVDGEECRASADAPGFLIEGFALDAERGAQVAPIEVRLRRSGTLEVQVVEDGTGKPVPGVEVWLEESNVQWDAVLTTDDTGRCSRPGLPPGSVVVYALGGGWVSREFAAPEGWNRDTNRVEIPQGGVVRRELVVVRAPRIRGRVLDARGAGVPRVRVRGSTGDEAGEFLRGFEPLGEVTTDDAGAFEFPEAIPGVRCRLDASPSEWPLAFADIAPLLRGEVASVTLQLPEARSVEVRTFDAATGSPVPATEIHIEIPIHSRHSWSFRAGETGADGIVVLGPLPARPVELSVYSVVGQIKGTKATVSPEDHGPIELRITRLDEPRDLVIEGVVTMPDGSPAVGAAWECWEQDEYVLRCFAAPDLTDFRGRFRAEGLRKGPHRVTASLQRDGRTYRRETGFPAGARDAVVRLEDQDLREAGLLDDSPLRLRVLGPDGKPIHEAAASVVFVTEGGDECTYVRVLEGACGVTPPAEGTWTMWVDIRDPVDASGAPLPLAHGRFGPFVDSAGETEIRLRPEVAIAGRVVDGAGRGVPGAEVKVQFDASAEAGGSGWSSPNDPVRAGPDGRFRIGRLGDYPYLLDVDPGESYSKPPQLRANGGADSVLVEVRDAVAPIVTVLGPDGRPVQGAEVFAGPDAGAVEQVARSRSGLTDSRGEVRLAGLDPKCDHDLSVNPPDEREDIVGAAMGSWRPADTTVRLERGFPFTVIVRDRTGRPLDGIAVSLTIGEAALRTRSTDVEGAARFRRIPAGPLHIEASIQGPGGAPGAIATTTSSTEQGRAEIVLDIGGEALLRVKGWESKWSGLAYFAHATDLEPTQTGVGDDGTVRLRGLRTGHEYIVYIRASHPDLDSPDCALVRGVRAGEPPRDIELVEGKDITGRVNLPEGADGFAVAALVGKTVMIDGYAETQNTFRIPAVPEGTWTIVVYLTTEDGKYHAATGTAAAGGSVEIRVP